MDYIDGEAYVLLGLRKGSHGEGQWAFPGGHLEYMESFYEAAKREIAEEVGKYFRVNTLEVCTVTNLKDYAPKHYIDIGMTARYIDGEPIVMEPDKVEVWKWVHVDDIYSMNLFSTVINTVEAALSHHFQDTGMTQVYDS